MEQSGIEVHGGLGSPGGIESLGGLQLQSNIPNPPTRPFAHPQSRNFTIKLQAGKKFTSPALFAQKNGGNNLWKKGK